MKKTFSPRTTTWVMLFVVAVSWPSTGFSQDSLQNYSLARWKVDRLIKIALKAKECDSLVNDQQHLINADMRLQIKADSVISAQSYDIRLYHEDISKRDSLDVVNQEIIGIQEKQINKWKVVSSASAGGIIGSFFSPLGTAIGFGIGGFIGLVSKNHSFSSISQRHIRQSHIQSNPL